MASSTEIEEFLAGPLVTWLKTCVDDIDNKLNHYENYFDGFPFRDVLMKIDPEPQDPVPSLTSFSTDISLVSARLQIFYTTFVNIQTIYMTELNQLVIKTPDLMILAQEPSTRFGLEQLKYLLQLLLAVAVQGPTREFFVKKIQELPETKQAAIAEIIAQYTEGQTAIANLEGAPFSPKTCYDWMLELVTERNNFLKQIVEDARKKMEGESCVIYESEKERQQQHLAVEIVDYKSQIRRLKTQIDERNDSILELTEELEKVKTHNQRLQNENRKLQEEKIKAIRSEDEWESLREKAAEAEFLEKEAIQLRKNLIEAKSNKNRAEQLFNDKKILERNNEMLETNLNQILQDMKESTKAELKLLIQQQHTNDLELELEASRAKREELEKTVSELQQVIRMAHEKTYEEDEIDESARSDSYSYNVSIQEEINNNAEAKILQLQMEKRKLQRQVDSLEHQNLFEKAEQVLELEKDKKRLSLQVESLQGEVDRLKQGAAAVEKLFQKTIEENSNLQNKVSSLKTLNDQQATDLSLEKERQANLHRTIDFCNREKDHVMKLCDAIKNRADKSEKANNDLMETVAKLRKDLDESREMEVTNQRLKDDIESLQKEVGNLQKELTKTKELLEEKSVVLDQRADEMATLERQVEALTKERAEMLEHVEKLQVCEMKAQELLSQAAVHSETITTLQKDLVTEKINNEKFKYNVEKLGLSLDVLENDINVVLETMLDNLEISKSLTAIFKTRDSGVVDADKLEEMASSLTEEWRQQVEKLQAEVSGLLSANEGLKKENASLQVDVSTLKSQFQSLQMQQTALQLANSQLVAEKEDLARKNQLQQSQHRTLSHDQNVLGKIHEELTTEYEKLQEEKETLKKNNRDLKTEVRTGKEKLESLENKIKSLEQELEKAKEDSKHLSYLRVEHSKLKNDFRNLLATSERFKAEFKASREEISTIRTELLDAKTENIDMKREFGEKADLITTLQMENAMLHQKCELLQENLNKLDLTRISLLDSYSELCKQSLACMAESMDRQNLSQMEAKHHWEQYNNILRQKVKLEEKIFDFYKKLDNVNTKKGGFASLVRRVRKAGSGIMSRSRSNRRSSEEENSPATPLRAIEAAPQVPGPSCSGSGESNTSSTNGNESDEEAIRPDPLQRTPSGSLHGHRPRDEVALRRSQRQQSRRNSVASEELLLRDSPSLGSIGSRRTVYISEDEPVPSPTPVQQTPSRENNPPLLVYNRISTVIGNDTLCTLGNQTNLPEIPRENMDNKKPVNPKETAVWYEYGCV